MHIQHQCILSVDNLRILVIPEKDSFGIKCPGVADFVLCSHNQYNKYKNLIDIDMKEEGKVIFTDEVE